MKGLFVALFAVCLYQAVDADYGPWTPFGACQCDGTETRTRVCDRSSSGPCVGPYSEWHTCACVPFVANIDCPMVVRADSLYGIVADPCACQNYIQCDFNVTTAEFIGHIRQCNPCQIWNQEVLTCVRDPGKSDCVYELSTEEPGECYLLEVPGSPNKFLLGGAEVTCANGGLFNVTLCTCVHGVRVDRLLEQVTCLTFDTGISASRLVYVHNSNVEHVTDTANCAAGSCALFNGTLASKLELAHFSNAFDRYTSFSVAFFYRKLSTTVAASGLVLDNSDCGHAASLSVGVGVNSVSSSVMNQQQEVATSTAAADDDDVYHHYALSYDGHSVTTYLDTVLVDSVVLGGKIDRVKAPLVVGGCICGGDDCYFDGYLDTLTFIKGALTATDVSTLNANPGQCMP